MDWGAGRKTPHQEQTPDDESLGRPLLVLDDEKRFRQQGFDTRLAPPRDE